MSQHPTMIAAHIAVTTASACRKRPRRISRISAFAIAAAALALCYFGART